VHARQRDDQDAVGLGLLPGVHRVIEIEADTHLLYGPA